jgi:glycosyltransferase involved in cell wall biosynthesis
MKKISVVIPSYNRGKGLNSIIEEILKSKVDDFSSVEIIVVDDGSSTSAKSFLKELAIPAPFSLSVIRQKNAGPAAARNNGLQNAKNEIVLFIDDDILVTPGLLNKHAEGHIYFPQSIIYGSCPFVVPEKKSPSYRFLIKLAESKPQIAEGKDAFILTQTIASGNISIEKSCFPEGEFYKTSLRSPVAEEYELIARLLVRKIKAYSNPSIIGWHLQPANIESKCQQEFKYGVGIAEVSLKIPYANEYKGLKKLYEENREIRNADSGGVKIKKTIKRLVSGEKGRRVMIKSTKILERVLPFDGILFPAYRLLCGCNLYAGVQEGIKRFKDQVE